MNYELIKVILRAEKVAYEKDCAIINLFGGDFKVFDHYGPFDQALTILGIPEEYGEHDENGNVILDKDFYCRDWAYDLLYDYLSGEITEDDVIEEIKEELKRLAHKPS